MHFQSKYCMIKGDDGQAWGNYSGEEQELYDILTGKIKYMQVPWKPQDLEPDLIISMRLPKSQAIEVTQFLSLSTYISSPSYAMTKVFSRAEKTILEDMSSKGQNKSLTTIKLRFQKAIQITNTKVKRSLYIDEEDEAHTFQVECIHEKSPILDAFTLQYNAIVYTLQKICGFRVRAFLVYDEELKDERIFLFLNMNIENRLKMACRFSIKKEIDYSLIDFYLNEACTEDGRPIKAHSSQFNHNQVRTFYKQLSRYFKLRDPHMKQITINNQSQLSYSLQDKFLLQTEDLINLLDLYKTMNEPILTKHQKQYIHKYNKNKINRGCKLLYHKYQQRMQFWQMIKYLSDYYGFPTEEEPVMFEEVFIPSKEYIGAGYFQRLKAILLYKPQIVKEDGSIDLFLKMEKIKLAYVILKSTFKINFLQKIGFDFIALSSKFELTGEGGNEQVKGGVNGKNVVDSWPLYGYFTELNVVRNYFGNIVGHEISFKIYMIYFLTALMGPYLVLYILQTIFRSNFYFISNFIKLILMAIGFRVFLTIWIDYQEDYVQKFSDSVSSRVFLSNYRGPYIRNLITDEINEYGEENIIIKTIKNIICILIIGLLLTIVGFIFYGFRMFLLLIYEDLAGLRADFFSVPHLLAYFLFFLFVDIFRYVATNRMINLLINLKNPGSDEQARQLGHKLRFFYLLGIQMIAPTFFLIIEPFQGTSCYARNCINEIIYYVYARYQIKLGQVLFRFLHLVYHKSKNVIHDLLEQKQQIRSFQAQIQKIINDALQQQKKKVHENSNAFDMIAIIGYAIYSIMLPLVVLISLFSILIDTFNVRSFLIYQERRTINQSQRILTFKNQLNIIYFVGILVNAWIMVFPFRLFNQYFTGGIEAMAPTPTSSDVFLAQLFWTMVISIAVAILGMLAGFIAQSTTASWLKKRKKNKFNAFFQQGYTLKVKPSQPSTQSPIKTIFRTHNPEHMNHELLEKMLREINIHSGEELTEQINTFSGMTRTRE